MRRLQLWTQHVGRVTMHDLRTALMTAAQWEELAALIQEIAPNMYAVPCLTIRNDSALGVVVGYTSRDGSREKLSYKELALEHVFDMEQ